MDNAIRDLEFLERMVVQRRPLPTTEDLAKTPDITLKSQAGGGGNRLVIEKYVRNITRDFPDTPTRTQILTLLRSLQNE